MIRTMFDGVNPAQVPAGAAIYAGYVDGEWQSYNELAAANPTARHVSICVAATGSARVLDVEKGDATPDQAPGWAETQRRSGNPYPVVYCNEENTWPAVKAAFTQQGVEPPLYWVAAYVDDAAHVPVVPDGAIALQYYDYGGYDASAVAAYWPGLDPAPQTAQVATGATQTVPQEDDVTTYYPIQVGPDPTTQAPWACGVATWPAGATHVLQLVADPGLWGDTEGQFQLVFSMLTGPDVKTIELAKPSESIAVEFASVAGLNPAICRGVTITRPDGKKWPWGGGAE